MSSIGLPFVSTESILGNVGGDGGSDRSFTGDLCSSPDEFVPSDWVSEPKNEIIF